MIVESFDSIFIRCNPFYISCISEYCCVSVESKGVLVSVVFVCQR